MLRKNLKFIGACCKYGQTKDGVEQAPKIISNFFKKKYFDFIDIQDENGYIELFKLHNKYLQNSNNIITIGGDHSISLATCASSADIYKDDLKIIWIDAHADINTRDSSLTKNMHGMPVASLLGLDNIFKLPTINPEQIIYIGLRDLDDFEVETIKKLDIENYTTLDIKNKGINNILNNINIDNKKIHMSFDVDVIDPILFSSTGTLVNNGLDYTEVENIFDKFKPNLISADFVEFNTLLTEKIEGNHDSIKLFRLINYLIN